jgi:hypothetical protein
MAACKTGKNCLVDTGILHEFESAFDLLYVQGKIPQICQQRQQRLSVIAQPFTAVRKRGTELFQALVSLFFFVIAISSYHPYKNPKKR